MNQAREALKKGGIDWTEVWIRLQIGSGTIKSEKKFGSRVIPRLEIERIIKERLASRERF